MTTDDPVQPPAPPPARPHAELATLQPLVGTWEMTGRDFGTDAELSGRLRYEWMAGGFFLIQHVDIRHVDEAFSGIELIGYDEAGRCLTGSYFDSTGNRFTYVWELRGDALTIWFGSKGSPAGFSGTLADGGDTIVGKWEWPGGGYSATMTRVRD